MVGLGIRLMVDRLFYRNPTREGAASLVTPPKFMSKNGKEICVVCQEKTDVDFKTPIDQRRHYVEGCGQHCAKCCKEKNLCWHRGLAK